LLQCGEPVFGRVYRVFEDLDRFSETVRKLTPKSLFYSPQAAAPEEVDTMIVIVSASGDVLDIRIFHKPRFCPLGLNSEISGGRAQ
jgi:hypothetical protein